MKSTLFVCAVFAVFAAALLPMVIAAAEPVDFRPDAAFHRLPDSLQLGACSAAAVNSRGEIFLFHRGKQPLICLDWQGKFLHAWGDDLIRTAHGLRVDGEDNVWVTDIGSHRVLKFDRRGKLLLALGRADAAGDGIDQFNKPTDIAFGRQGEIYISDGYGNSRVVKLTPHGGFLMQWGEAGNGPGQFRLPHSILVDGEGRVLVGDRENNRIQVFDAGGKLLAVWPGFAPYGMTRDRQGNLFVADGRANQVLQLDGQGKVVRSWGQRGAQPGQFQMPHMLAADADGNLYVAEVKGERFQKLIRSRPLAAIDDSR